MTDYSKLIHRLEKLATEQVNADTIDIDRLDAAQIVRKINREDQKVAEVVASASDAIAQTATMYADVLRAGGRVFYVGAGTSGRLGVLDAAECPPTFGTDPSSIVGVISGGYDTLVMSREGVEDDIDQAYKDMQQHNLTAADMVIGLAASTRTPYTLAALEYARSIKASTAFIFCNSPGTGLPAVDVLISLPVGPEVIAGSTRMKSGTAQKMTLNAISTTAMVLLGKTYGNLMVDLIARSKKLAARSRMILMNLLSISLDESGDLLRRADGSVKTAIVMHRFRLDKDQARQRLDDVGGFLYKLDQTAQE